MPDGDPRKEGILPSVCLCLRLRVHREFLFLEVASMVSFSNDFCFRPEALRNDTGLILSEDEREKVIRNYSEWSRELETAGGRRAADILANLKIQEWLFGYPQEAENAGL